MFCPPLFGRTQSSNDGARGSSGETCPSRTERREPQARGVFCFRSARRPHRSARRQRAQVRLQRDEHVAQEAILLVLDLVVEIPSACDASEPRKRMIALS